MRSRESSLLFTKGDMFSLLDHLSKSATKKVNDLPEPTVLGVGSSVLAKEIEEEFTLAVPNLKEDQVYVTDRETDVDISRDPRYFVMRGEQAYKKGIELTFHVPFDGDANLFDYQPNAYTSCPPRATVEGSELLLSFVTVDHDGDGQKIKDDFQRELSGITQYLGWMRSQATEYNNKLLDKILAAIEQRKQKLLKDRGLVASLGFPIRHRNDAAPTYTAPVTRRTLPVSRPNTVQPFIPEPSLDQAEYEHILGVVSQMVTVMERSPSAFVTMREEDLRQHFLVQLNGQYEGQASGETFNYEGKTDILIRASGRNIFIAECKFWTGEKGFLETIDQILSYVSWRDTKTAILLFNRNKDFSKVLEQIVPSAIKHKNHLRQVEFSHESGFRFIFTNRDDSQRQLTLTILAFDVPQGEGRSEGK